MKSKQVKIVVFGLTAAMAMQAGVCAEEGSHNEYYDEAGQVLDDEDVTGDEDATEVDEEDGQALQDTIMGVLKKFMADENNANVSETLRLKIVDDVTNGKMAGVLPADYLQKLSVGYLSDDVVLLDAVTEALLEEFGEDVAVLFHSK